LGQLLRLTLAFRDEFCNGAGVLAFCCLFAELCQALRSILFHRIDILIQIRVKGSANHR
jgi:hypothetical protein